ELTLGEEVQVFPAGPKTRIRNLQVHGKDTDRALAGQRTAVNLQGIEIGEGMRGTVIAPAGRIRPTNLLDGRLYLLPSASRSLSQRARIRLQHGTAEIMARVVILESDTNAAERYKEGQERARPGQFGTQIDPGASGFVQFRLETPVAALPGDRFNIRSYS